MLFVTGVVVFSGQFFAMAERWLGRNWLFPHGLEVTFWIVLVLVTLAPLVAIWRNLSAMAMLYAEISTKGNAHVKRLRPWSRRVSRSARARCCSSGWRRSCRSRARRNGCCCSAVWLAVVALVVLRHQTHLLGTANSRWSCSA